MTYKLGKCPEFRVRLNEVSVCGDRKYVGDRPDNQGSGGCLGSEDEP